MEEMNKLIKAKLMLAKAAKEIKSEIDNVDSDIKLQLEIMDTNFYEDVHGTTVDYKESIRKGFDNKKAKEFLSEEQIVQCTKETTFHTLRVKNKDENERVQKFVEKSKEEKENE